MTGLDVVLVHGERGDAIHTYAMWHAKRIWSVDSQGLLVPGPSSLSTNHHFICPLQQAAPPHAPIGTPKLSVAAALLRASQQQLEPLACLACPFCQYDQLPEGQVGSSAIYITLLVF